MCEIMEKPLTIGKGAQHLFPMVNSLSALIIGFIEDLTTDVMMLSDGPLTFTLSMLFIED